MCGVVWLFTLCYRPQGSGRALKLGGKKDVESFVDQLKSEGERTCCLQLSIYIILSYLTNIF